MPVPQLTQAQSRRRVAELKRAGCEVETRRLPDGTRVVLKKCPDALLENQVPAPSALGYLVLAAFAGAALYAIFRPRKAAAAAASPGCPSATPENLRLYGQNFSVAVVQLAEETSPPVGIARQDGRIILYSIEEDRLIPFTLPGASATEPQSFAQPLVVVLGNGEFWRYEGPAGQAVQEKLSPRDRENFCTLARQGAVSGIQWIEG